MNDTTPHQLLLDAEAGIVQSLTRLELLKSSIEAERPRDDLEGERPSGPPGTLEAVLAELDMLARRSAALLVETQRTVERTRMLTEQAMDLGWKLRARLD